MSARQPEGDIASRWRREASEELRAAEVVAAHDEVPDRVAGFHAHLAAEKALKSLLIDRGVEVPRIHDLIGLHRLLPEMDQARFDPADLETLNPWTIEGRYPADLPDVDDVVLVETSPRPGGSLRPPQGRVAESSFSGIDFYTFSTPRAGIAWYNR